MAEQCQIQKTEQQLTDAMLTEVWNMMHFAIAPEIEMPTVEHRESQFNAEGECDELETDSPYDVNANEKDADIKKMGNTLANIGDSYSKHNKADENAFIDDIVKALKIKAEGMNDSLESILGSKMPSQEMLKTGLVDLAYNEVKSKFEEFLVGSEGLTQIAVVTHITRGVSMALREVSAPAVSLAAAVSFRFVSEKCANLILESGGLHNLITSSSMDKKEEKK